MISGPVDRALQQALEERSHERVAQLATELLVRKAGKRGARIAPSQKARLKRWLKGGCSGEFSLRLADGGADITVTSRELRRLQGRFMAQLEADAEKAAAAAIKAAVPRLRRSYAKTWPAHSRHLARLQRGFERRLYARYRAGFELLSLQVTLGRELGDEVNQEARARKRRRAPVAFVDVLTRLHARSCQIADEVAALLRSGYADGAMARWRSLHEVSVILQFIAEHGPETAVRYAEHEAVESLKAARGYNAAAERLNHAPYTAAELAAMEKETRAITSKYEADYDSEYGWAAVALKKRKPSFADIEKAVGLDHFRPYYKFASHNVHANPKGIFYRLCVLGDRSILPTGATNVGLTDPAQNTAIAVARATAVVAQLAPSSADRWCVIGVMNELVGEIAAAFWRAEQAIQKDEARLRRAK